MNHPLLEPVEFYVKGTDRVMISRRKSKDEKPRWAVTQHGNCLNRNGEWEWEPNPSSRDIDFLSRCRFDSIDEAMLAYERRKER